MDMVNITRIKDLRKIQILSRKNWQMLSVSVRGHIRTTKMGPEKSLLIS